MFTYDEENSPTRLIVCGKDFGVIRSRSRPDMFTYDEENYRMRPIVGGTTLVGFEPDLGSNPDKF